MGISKAGNIYLRKISAGSGSGAQSKRDLGLAMGTWTRRLETVGLARNVS